MAVHPLVLDSEDLRILNQHDGAAALDRLYRSYSGPLLRFCTGRLGATDAEDAAHEAMLRLHLALSRSKPGPVWPWLVTIAGNVCKQMISSRKRMIVLDEPMEDSFFAQGDDLEEEVENHLRSELVDQAIVHLPTRYQHFLWLRHFDRLSYKEIANLYDVTIGTVRSVLLRARRALRKEIETLAKAKGQWPLSALVPGFRNRLRSSVDNWRNSVHAATSEALQRLGGMVVIQSVIGLLPRLGEAAFASALAAGVSLVALGGTYSTTDASVATASTGSERAVFTENGSEPGASGSHVSPLKAEVVPPSKETTNEGGTLYSGPALDASIEKGDEKDFNLDIGPTGVYCPPPEKRGITLSIACPILNGE